MRLERCPGSEAEVTGDVGRYRGTGHLQSRCPQCGLVQWVTLGVPQTFYEHTRERTP